MSVYLTHQPVHDHPSFVGREVLLKSLGEALGRGRIFVLMGATKTGRTSVLSKLVDKARAALRQPLTGTKQVVVYVDLKTLDAPNPAQLVQLLWTALQNTVLDPYVQSHGDPPRPVKLELLRTADPWQVFGEAAETLWSKLANTPGWCRYSFLLDNADALAAAGWGGAVHTLAQMLSRTEGARPQGVGFAGGLGMRAILAPHRKAMAAARLHVLEPLRANDVQALARLGTLPADAAEVASYAVGGHPWLLQQLFAAMEAQPDTDASVVGSELAPQLAPYFNAVLATLPPPARGTGISAERSLLAWLLERGGEGDAFEAENQLGLGPLRAAGDHLVATGFLERSVRGRSGTWLRLGANLFNEWARDALQL